MSPVHDPKRPRTTSVSVPCFRSLRASERVRGQTPDAQCGRRGGAEPGAAAVCRSWAESSGPGSRLAGLIGLARCAGGSRAVSRDQVDFSVACLASPVSHPFRVRGGRHRPASGGARRRGPSWPSHRGGCLSTSARSAVVRIVSVCSGRPRSCCARRVGLGGCASGRCSTRIARLSGGSVSS
jgi:hypothetical protein